MKHKTKNQIIRFIDKHGLTAATLGDILGVPARTMQKWTKIEHYPELVRRALNDLERDIKAGNLKQLTENTPSKPNPIKSKLEYVRKMNGMSLRDLAEKAGKSHQAIARQEKFGLKDHPSAVVYAEILGTTPEKLLEDIKYDSKFAALVGEKADLRKLASALKVDNQKIRGYMTRGVCKEKEAEKISEVLYCKVEEVLED